MSCTVVAVPMALAYIITSVVIPVAISGIGLVNKSEQKNNEEIDLHSLVNKEDIIEKNFETPFIDKDILIKTLKEHGVNNFSEDYSDNITCYVDNFKLNFFKKELDGPYILSVSCSQDNCNFEERFNDITSEYTLNVQEKSYLSIINKLKDNNLQVEEEEVMEDNTIVLTVNLE